MDANEDLDAPKRFALNIEQLVTRHVAGFTSELSSDGIRQNVTAALLMRSSELLRELIELDKVTVPTARGLLFRALIESVQRGRYLLVADDADEELGRMKNAYRKQRTAATEWLGDQPVEVEPLLELVPEIRGSITNAFDIAKKLDVLHGVTTDMRSSSVRLYKEAYQPLSNATVHSGLNSIKRFTELVRGYPAIRLNPRESSFAERRFYVLGCEQVLRFAIDFFDSVGVDQQDIESLSAMLPPDR